MGSISVNFGSGNAYTVTTEWTQGAQSITNNTTSVKFVCTLKSNRSSVTFTGAGKTDKLTVNGKTYNPQHGAFTVPGGGSVKLWEYTATITHDEDGSFDEKAISCEVGIGVQFSSSGYIETVTASGSITLDTIPRASTMTISGSALGSAVSFAVTAAASTFRHTLTYKYGNASGTIFSGQAGGTKKWTPPLTLAAQFPNAKSGAVTYTLTTRNGTAVIGEKTYTSTLSIPAAAGPAASSGWASAGYYNEDTAAAGIDAFVQGYSRAQVTFDAGKITTQYGAAIKGYRIACGGMTDDASPYLTGVLTGTTAEIVCTVEDSRGYTASETLDIVLLPYSRPTLSDISLYRSNPAGEYDSAGVCIFAKAKVTFSALDGMNECPLYGYFRLQAGSYGAATEITEPTIGGFITTEASDTKTFVAKITATDRLGNSVSYEATIPTDSVAFHIRDGGKGAAFFKYAEKDGVLEVNGAIELAEALGIASGGTGAKTLGELIQTVFTNGEAASVTEYPTRGGIYAALGTDIFSNLTMTHSTYGVLVIFSAFIYKLHIYLDAEKRLFYGWGSSDGTEPATWQKIDAIVEQGTSGIWTYRKYQSGMMECWGSQTVTAYIQTAWNGWYQHQFTPPDYPVAFESAPVISRDATSDSGYVVWLVPVTAGTTTNMGMFALMRPVQADGASVTIHYRAVGRWA